MARVPSECAVQLLNGAMSYKRMCEEEPRLSEEVAGWLKWQFLCASHNLRMLTKAMA